MAEEVANEMTEDEFLKSVMGELDSLSFTSKSIKIVYMPSEVNDLNLRLVTDKNGKLFHSGWVYKVKGVQIIGESGEVTSKDILAAAPPRNEDPVAPLADLLGWGAKASPVYIMYAYIQSPGNAKSKYFDAGPSLLVVNRSPKRFLDSYKAAISMLAQKKKEEAIHTLKAEYPGYGFVVSLTKGAQGKANVLVDTLSDKIVIPQEMRDELGDLTSFVNIIPKFGPTNDCNLSLIKNHYEKVLSQSSAIADPTGGDVLRSTGSLANVEDLPF